MKTTPFQRALLAATAGLALAGCGGGGGSSASVDATVPPASASASSQGFLAYIAGFANGMFDSAEPFDLSAFSAPPDDADTAEPAATPADA